MLEAAHAVMSFRRHCVVASSMQVGASVQAPPPTNWQLIVRPALSIGEVVQA
jgi:hypothetical protein